MAAPVFIQEAETAWNSATTPKTTAAFDGAASDVLVAVAVTGDSTSTVAVTNNGTALTWTQQQVVAVASRTWVSVWTTVLAAARPGLTVTLTLGGSTNWFGGNVLTFRGADGVGASNKANNASGAPSLGLTTTQANSAIVVVVGDWSGTDGAARAWRTGAGALTEVSYFRDAAQYTIYAGYHADAGAAAAQTVGLTTPVQQYAIAAVEIIGSVRPQRQPRISLAAITRAATR